MEGRFEVARGPAADAVISAQANILPMLRLEASGGLLRVFVDGSFSSTEPILALLTPPNLRSAELTGSGSISALDVDAPDFSARLRAQETSRPPLASAPPSGNCPRIAHGRGS